MVVIVMQCAGKKRNHNSFELDGKKVNFVARPEEVEDKKEDEIYARPDDIVQSEDIAWRDKLAKYNQDYKSSGSNPYGFAQADELYDNDAYDVLAKKYSPNFYILSAGWGMIRGNFLTPYYDITFSNSAEKKSQRKKTDYYRDYKMPDDVAEPIVFFGGNDYLPLFCSLTKHIKTNKYVFYNSDYPPKVPFGYKLKKYKTTIRTNWHYKCAKEFTEGLISLDQSSVREE